MMRIRRLLVDKLFGKSNTTEEQESLFSEITRADAVDQIYGDRDPQSRRAMLEVMKIIEMYDHPVLNSNTDTGHWIEKTTEAMSRVVGSKYFPAQAIFSPIDWKGGVRVLGSNVISKINSKYNSPEDFIEKYVMNQLLTESRVEI